MTEPAARFPYVDPRGLRSVAIVCHRHADADAYLSAYALARLFRQISPDAKTEIVTPEGLTALTEQLHARFQYPTTEESESDYDLFVAVDLGHTELLKNWLGKITLSRGFKVLIDHHPLQKDSIYDRMVVDTSASSTAEVVFRLFTEMGAEIDEETAQALLVALLFDSQHLAIASEKALRACLGLIDHGADIGAARKLLRSPPDYGEVIAKLKGARRSRIFRLNGWVVALSNVGSFQAHVARALVQLGADVAAVAGDFDDETRESLRSSYRFHTTTNIHLGVDLAEVLPAGKGYGGGHATAASFTSALGEDEALKATLALLEKLLKGDAVEVK